MAKRNIVVVGASGGGVTALVSFVKSLPPQLEASIFIVLHVPPFSQSRLPEILSSAGHFKAVHPNDGDSIKPGLIYVANNDRHLLVEEGRVLVKKGPKENRFRPSVDALFRSAAYTYGSRVIGIILSGMLDDGTSGLWTIKQLGGVGIIQEPSEAMFPQMPENVLEYIEVDHRLPVADMGALLKELCAVDAPGTKDLNSEDNICWKRKLPLPLGIMRLN